MHIENIHAESKFIQDIVGSNSFLPINQRI